jgi:glucose/arabinose dehydrogenase
MLGLYPLPGEPDQALVLTQDGYLYRVSLSDSFAPVLFGHLGVRMVSEEGLLGLAFSPDYANDGYVYLYYNLPPVSTNKIRDVLSRFPCHNNALTRSQTIRSA